MLGPGGEAGRQTLSKAECPFQFFEFDTPPGAFYIPLRSLSLHPDRRQSEEPIAAGIPGEFLFLGKSCTRREALLPG
jgi:hypothetical protein